MVGFEPHWCESFCKPRHVLFVTAEERIRELENSHDQLRRALAAAGMHIRKFRNNPKNEKMIHVLRKVLCEARLVRKPEGSCGQAAPATTRVHGALPIQSQPNFDVDSMI